MKKKMFLLNLLLLSNFIFSQIGIGTTKPAPSAILDVNVDNLSSKKGILFPRVALTSNNDSTTIPSPVQSLIIYNTGENPGFSTPGFYYWAGKEWRLLDSSTGINPTIYALQCGSAILTPPKYVAGTKYFGTITLPYTMGNGGTYFSGDSKTVNGLTYQLQSGKLNYGNGNIYYTVSGTPTVSSPTASVFNLDFLTYSCTATLGDLNEIKTIQYARKYTTPIDANTPTNSITTIGNIQVRYNAITDSDAQNNFIEFRSLVDTHVTIKYDKAGAGGQNLELWGKIAAKADGNWHKLADDSWVFKPNNPHPISGDYPNYSSGQKTYPDLNSTYRDIGTVLLTFHNTQEVYRINLNVSGDISTAGGVPASPSGVTIFIEKLE